MEYNLSKRKVKSETKVDFNRNLFKELIRFYYKMSHKIALKYRIFAVFVIFEIFDELIDLVLIGNLYVHVIVQFSLFFILFLVVMNFFKKTISDKIQNLISEDLMEILRIIKDAEIHGLLINQTKIRIKLNVTKPTIKKKIDQLLDLGYIFFKEDGNHKYFSLTEKGNSILR